MGLAILTAIGGYAIGTLQILTLDWNRARRRHAQHLRLLRSELRRARVRHSKFGWMPGRPPQNDLVPEPPAVSDVFSATVARTDFHLTDEFEGDNSQEALFGLLDGLDQLRRYRDDTLRAVDLASGASSPTEKQRHLEHGYALAAEYDGVVDVVLCQMDSALEDIERRLKITTVFRQLLRPIGKLPSGTAPLPIKAGDPRLEEWRKRQGE